MTSKNINEKNRYNKITQSSPISSERNGENINLNYKTTQITKNRQHLYFKMLPIMMILMILLHSVRKQIKFIITTLHFIRNVIKLNHKRKALTPLKVYGIMHNREFDIYREISCKHKRLI